MANTTELPLDWQAQLAASQEQEPVPVHKLFTEADLVADVRALPETSAAVTAEAERVFKPRYRLYRTSELGQFPPVEWFEGLEGVVPRGELVGLWGPGDSYKSFVALDWACHVSLTNFVLYVAAEGASGIQGRIAAWAKRNGYADLPNLFVMPAPLRMHVPGDVNDFVAAVRSQLAGAVPAMVVIDTLARNFVGGNENSAQDMGLFVEGAETIRRTFGSTVPVVHHSTKDGSSERGNEALRNSSFAMYRFDRTGKRSVTVVCERMKDAEPPKPVKLNPQVVELPEIGDDVSSLAACWPYGADLTPVVVLDDKAIERQAQMDRDIIEYLRHEREVAQNFDDSHCSQNQIAKNVRGMDSTVITRLKILALDSVSPVVIERDGKTVRYVYDVPSV